MNSVHHEGKRFAVKIQTTSLRAEIIKHASVLWIPGDDAKRHRILAYSYRLQLTWRRPIKFLSHMNIFQTQKIAKLFEISVEWPVYISSATINHSLPVRYNFVQNACVNYWQWVRSRLRLRALFISFFNVWLSLSSIRNRNTDNKTKLKNLIAIEVQCHPRWAE